MPIYADKIATLLLFFAVKAFFVFLGGRMSEKKYKKEDCILLLQNKYKELQMNIKNRIDKITLLCYHSKVLK